MSFADQIPEIPKGKGVAAWKSLASCVWFALRGSPGHAVLTAGIFAATPFVQAAFFFFTKRLVDAFGADDTATAVRMFWFLIAAFILRAVIDSLRSYVQDALRLNLDGRLRERTMLVLNGLDPALVEHPKFQALYHAYDNEGRGDILSLVQGTFWITYRALELLGTLSVLVVLPWWIALILLALMVPLVWLQRQEKSWSWSILDMESREGRRGLYYGEVLMGSAWLTSRWALGLHQLFYERWRKIVQASLARRLVQARLRVRGQLFTQFVVFVGFVLGGWSLLKDALVSGGIGSLIVFFPAYERFSSSMSAVLGEVSWIQTRLTCAQLQTLVWALPQRVDGSAGLRKKPLEIVFDRVSFAYPDQEALVLRDLSLRLREGETVALVGLNGAGKSTFLKLLAGVYQPTRGAILVNGIPLCDVRADDWRAVLGYLGQQAPEFDDAVREQVRYGDPDRAWSKARGNAALRVSGFDGVVAGLPRGLNTHVGRQYAVAADAPVELSGGQRQLLGIARTLYRRARVFIFDEPTSAVDAEKEEAFFRRLPEAVQGKLCLFVSHRFSVLRRAERILVMDAGRIIEDGSHEELLAKEGRYAELFALQAKMYQ